MGPSVMGWTRGLEDRTWAPEATEGTLVRRCEFHRPSHPLDGDGVLPRFRETPGESPRGCARQQPEDGRRILRLTRELPVFHFRPR